MTGLLIHSSFDREVKMKKDFTKLMTASQRGPNWATTVVAGAILVAAFQSVAMARTPEKAAGSCSDRSLKGVYAFTISGDTLNMNGTNTVTKGLALTTFDGLGKLKQKDFVVNDGVPGPGDGNSLTGFQFQSGESGVYKVNEDCTGTAEIDLNVPVPHGSGGVIKLVFILSDEGGTMHAVVAEFTPPGASAPVLGTTRSEGHRITESPKERD
jgi:hypothetical protein